MLSFSCNTNLLCEIESVAANDPVFKRNLATSRMHVAMAYLHGNYLEILIEQLEEVCASPKWHARQAAIEFVQSMIFCNLFNARPYALRLHDLVLKCLFDERLEVRTVASTTLSGLYQCGYIQMIEHDLKYFRVMAKTNDARVGSTSNERYDVDSSSDRQEQ
ncbi:unnamed protein product [Rotaria sordida]|uniref:Uncharacterized protein n=1 Tax=Rotaria sordida TaxID=392033 RepID=A0A819LW34_9BILA|nr:unnamed protein product [Rotaria sordida]